MVFVTSEEAQLLAYRMTEKYDGKIPAKVSPLCHVVPSLSADRQLSALAGEVW